MSSQPIAQSPPDYSNFTPTEPQASQSGRLTFDEYRVTDVSSNADDSEARQSLFTRCLLVSFALLCPTLMGFYYGQAGSWTFESLMQVGGIFCCFFPDSLALRPVLAAWSFLLGFLYFVIALASKATTVFVVLCVYYWVSVVVLVFAKLYRNFRPLPPSNYETI